LKQQAVPPSPLVRRASRYHQPVSQGNNTLPSRPLVTTEPLAHRRKVHFLTYFGIGMLIVLAIVAVWNLVIVPAWQNYQDQLHYGDARITRLDADVGHGGVSTFIAFDLNSQITIIEIPGGNLGQSRIYRAGNLLGSDQEHKIIALEVRNVKGFGKPDLVIHVEGEDAPIVLYNNGSSFQWTLPR